MRITQEYVNGIDDAVFVKKIIRNDNYEILADKRDIIQYDDKSKYYIKFDYKVKINDTALLFQAYTSIVEKTIIDKIFFSTLEEAKYYMTYALHPSIVFSISDGIQEKYIYRTYMFFNNGITESLQNIDMQMEATYDRTEGQLFGIFGTNNFNNRNLIKCIDNVCKRYGIANKTEYNILQSNSVKDVLAEKAAAIEMLKKSFKEDKDNLSGVILEEIDRTLVYLDFLKKLAETNK